LKTHLTKRQKQGGKGSITKAPFDPSTTLRTGSDQDFRLRFIKLWRDKTAGQGKQKEKMNHESTLRLGSGQAKVGKHEKSRKRGAKRNGTQIRHKHGGQVHSV
jgi:hypothetical protein